MLSLSLTLIILGNVLFYIGWIRLEQRNAERLANFIKSLKDRYPNAKL